MRPLQTACLGPGLTLLVWELSGGQGALSLESLPLFFQG